MGPGERHIIAEGPLSEVVPQVMVMIFLLLVFILSITILLLIRQSIHQYLTTRKSRIKQKYHEILIECLFSSGEHIVDDCKIKGDRGKRLLYKTMIYLMHNLNGEYAEKLKTYFYEMGLEKYLLQNLRSKRWWIITQGLRDSRIMGYKKAVTFAEKYINAKQLELRVEAQISIMSMKTHDPFEFLNRLKRPFSPWARIHLFQEISFWEEKPDASQWLTSENPGVLVFALRVMTLWGQKGDNNLIHPLSDHPNPLVRSELISYAAHIKDKDLWNKGAMKYHSETNAVRQTIAKTSGMLPNISGELLINWFNKEQVAIIKIELARALLIHGQNDGLSQAELAALGSVA